MFFLYLALGLLGLIAGGWIGLYIWPRPFPAYDAPQVKTETVPIPPHLPPPVERYIRAVIGKDVPLVHSAVITGRANMRFGPLPFLGRWRFVHDGGHNYRHYMEATLFGRRIMKVNEHYLDRIGRMELPVGVIDNDPKINQAANMTMWAEAMWFPSVYVTDERVLWEPLTAHSARLIVPFEEGEDCFTVYFDPKTDLILRMEGMRWRDSKDEKQILWRLEPHGWVTINGVKVPSPASVTWVPDGKPWLICHVEDIAYNVDVSRYIRQHGL
ncbi:MAG: hypothetical protein H6670_12345 [Anaerolineaceae bacterium]|nr:hypothetical protein [Anaerolineaceae bacterium]